MLVRFLTGLLFILFLASCTHVKRDGPPRFFVDETKIPNATPKHEPLAKYGNKKSYVVFGKRYHTLKTSDQYSQIGVASWYGTKFHARKTSSGEPYDMLKMTAAHKTLPLPTYVEVTNLKNKRKIIVKVNDRGPFSNNRLIDLSYVAAKKLGMLGKGTALVRVTAINPGYHPVQTFANKQSHRQSRTVAHGKIFLQAGVFRNKQNAIRMQHRLKRLVSAPVNIQRRMNGFYVISIGPINDTAASMRLTNHLKTLGIETHTMV